MFDLKSDHLKRTKVCREGTLNAFKFLFLLNVKKNSEEYNSDFRKFAQKRPLHVIIFLTVSVLPNIFPARLAKCL